MVERLVFAGVLAAIAAIAAMASSTLGRSARVAPLMVALPTLALLLFEMVREALRQQATAGRDHQMTAAEGRLIAWLFAVPVFVGLAGVNVGVATWLAIFLRFWSAERWTISLALAVGLAFALYMVLTVILRVPLFAGALIV